MYFSLPRVTSLSLFSTCLGLCSHSVCMPHVFRSPFAHCSVDDPILFNSSADPVSIFRSFRNSETKTSRSVAGTDRILPMCRRSLLWRSVAGRQFRRPARGGRRRPRRRCGRNFSGRNLHHGPAALRRPRTGRFPPGRHEIAPPPAVHSTLRHRLGVAAVRTRVRHCQRLPLPVVQFLVNWNNQLTFFFLPSSSIIIH